MNLIKTLKRPLSWILAMAAAVVIAFPAAAQSDGMKEALVVTMRDGKTDNYFLEKRPTVTFDGAVCHIESDVLSADYRMADVLNAEFKLVKEGGIAETDASKEFKVDLTDPTKAVLSGLDGGDWVRVYSLDGTVHHAVYADADGVAVVMTDVLAPGVYIITTQSNKTFKLYKK